MTARKKRFKKPTKEDVLFAMACLDRRDNGQTKYRDTFPNVAYRLAMLGMSDKEIAPVLGVSYKSIDKWRREKPEFNEAIIMGREAADTQVVESLFNRAVGMEIEEEKAVMVDGQPQIIRLRRQLAPDTKAAQFWLTNRQKDRWRMRNDVNLGGQEDNPLLVAAKSLQGAAIGVKGPKDDE